MHDPKKQLDITLAEPLVFLRTLDPSGRLQGDPNDPPTLVRGILALHVVKPTAISSIEVELIGVLTINYPEGIGPRRIELQEKQKIYSSTINVFRADQVSRGRQSIHVDPGSSAMNSSEGEHVAAASLSRPPSLPRGRPERRGVVNTSLDLGPTPPYTAPQSPTPICPRLDVAGECSAQTLDELRQNLRNNLESQASCGGSMPLTSLPPDEFAHSNSTIYSVQSSASSDSVHRENDNRIDDLTRASSPLECDISCRNNATVPTFYLSQRDSSSFRTNSTENTHETQHRARGSHDPSNIQAGHSRLRLSLTSVLDVVKEITSRNSSRARSVARSEEGEHGQIRRTLAPEQGGESTLEVAGEGSHPNTLHLASCHVEHREHHLLGLGRVLGLERDHEKDKGSEHRSKEHGHGWKEFNPGTYSYPISFLLPPHLPPTFSLPHGTLQYSIKGVAHRPGTFTSKLTCQVPLLVVTAPAIGAGDVGIAGDPGPLFIEKQWQEKLSYSIGLSSRLLLLGSKRRIESGTSQSILANPELLVAAEVEAAAGVAYGTATLDLTLLPFEKVKVWRLDVVVEQRVRYVDERGAPLREDDRMQKKLLELQDTCATEEIDPMHVEEPAQKNRHKHKQDFLRIPLLPTPISPHRSPLLQYIPSSADPSVLAGPGPYALSINIGIPGCNGSSGGNTGLHFSVKQKSSGVRVEHTLRLVMRVECIHDQGNHLQEGDKKLFDITVQTPITILSCRCVPEYQTLPRYSQGAEINSQDYAACACQDSIVGQGQGHGDEVAHVLTPISNSSFEGESGTTDDPHSNHGGSRSSSHARVSGRANLLAISSHFHPSNPPSPGSYSHESGWHETPLHNSHDSHHYHRHSQLCFVSTSRVRAHSQTPPFLTPHPSRPPSPLVQYERLVSGLESEAGDAPPCYESVASGSYIQH